MSEIKYVTLPLDDETAESLRAGDIVRLSGKILVGRDAAHKRIVEAIKSGAESPVPIKDEVIYYAGPAPTPPGAVIGPIGPTTSGRMDPYAPLLIEKGLRGMIGKGKRTQAVLDLAEKLKDYRELPELTIEGENTIEDGHWAYILNEDSLQRVILQLFYKEI